MGFCSNPQRSEEETNNETTEPMSTLQFVINEPSCHDLSSPASLSGCDDNDEDARNDIVEAVQEIICGTVQGDMCSSGSNVSIDMINEWIEMVIDEACLDHIGAGAPIIADQVADVLEQEAAGAASTPAEVIEAIGEVVAENVINPGPLLDSINEAAAGSCFSDASDLFDEMPDMMAELEHLERLENKMLAQEYVEELRAKAGECGEEPPAGVADILNVTAEEQEELEEILENVSAAFLDCSDDMDMLEDEELELCEGVEAGPTTYNIPYFLRWMNPDIINQDCATDVRVEMIVNAYITDKIGGTNNAECIVRQSNYYDRKILKVIETIMDDLEYYGKDYRFGSEWGSPDFPLNDFIDYLMNSALEEIQKLRFEQTNLRRQCQGLEPLVYYGPPQEHEMSSQDESCDYEDLEGAYGPWEEDMTVNVYPQNRQRSMIPPPRPKKILNRPVGKKPPIIRPPQLAIANLQQKAPGEQRPGWGGARAPIPTSTAAWNTKRRLPKTMTQFNKGGATETTTTEVVTAVKAPTAGGQSKIAAKSMTKTVTRKIVPPQARAGARPPTQLKRPAMLKRPPQAPVCKRPPTVLKRPPMTKRPPTALKRPPTVRPPPARRGPSCGAPGSGIRPPMAKAGAPLRSTSAPPANRPPTQLKRPPTVLKRPSTLRRPPTAAQAPQSRGPCGPPARGLRPPSGIRPPSGVRPPSGIRPPSGQQRPASGLRPPTACAARGPSASRLRQPAQVKRAAPRAREEARPGPTFRRNAPPRGRAAGVCRPAQGQGVQGTPARNPNCVVPRTPANRTTMPARAPGSAVATAAAPRRPTGRPRSQSVFQPQIVKNFVPTYVRGAPYKGNTPKEKHIMRRMSDYPRGSLPGNRQLGGFMEDLMGEDSYSCA